MLTMISLRSELVPYPPFQNGRWTYQGIYDNDKFLSEGQTLSEVLQLTVLAFLKLNPPQSKVKSPKQVRGYRGRYGQTQMLSDVETVQITTMGDWNDAVHGFTVAPQIKTTELGRRPMRTNIKLQQAQQQFSFSVQDLQGERAEIRPPNSVQFSGMLWRDRKVALPNVISCLRAFQVRIGSLSPTSSILRPSKFRGKSGEALIIFTFDEDKSIFPIPKIYAPDLYNLINSVRIYLKEKAVDTSLWGDLIFAGHRVGSLQIVSSSSIQLTYDNDMDHNDTQTIEISDNGIDGPSISNTTQVQK